MKEESAGPAGANAEYLLELLRDPDIAKFTDEIVAEHLADMALSSLRDSAWMGRSVRTAYYFVRQFVAQAGAPANAAMAKEIEALATAADIFRAQISEVAEATMKEIMVFTVATSDLDRGGSMEMQALPNPDWDRFLGLRSELSWLCHFLTRAGSDLRERKQSIKWRKTQLKTCRIHLAVLLMDTFERAYGKKATIARYPETTSWADFYVRIWALLFGEKAVFSLEDVLNDARKLRFQDSVKLMREMMPQ